MTIDQLNSVLHACTSCTLIVISTVFCIAAVYSLYKFIQTGGIWN